MLKLIHINCVAVNIVKIYSIILVLCLELNTIFLSINMFPRCPASSLVLILRLTRGDVETLL
jgi:hypothetical protein